MKKTILICTIVSLFLTMSFGQNEYWAAFSQNVDIAKYQGLPFKLEAAVKVVSDMEEATAQVWLRGHDKDSSVSFMDNAIYPRQEANAEWKVLSIEGVLSETVELLLLGGSCDYNGSFYFDDFRLQVLKDEEWQPITLNNGDFENTTFEQKSYQGKTYAKKMIQGWGGFIVEENRATFSPTVEKEKMYQGNSALLIEGKGYFYAPTYLKKFAGEWNWEYMASLSDDFVKDLPASTSKWTTLHNGFALKEVTHENESKELIWENYTFYYPDVDKVVWNVFFEDEPPRLFEGKLDEKGNLSFEASDTVFSSEALKENYHLTWVNEDELAIVWNFYFPSMGKEVKRCWKVTRKKTGSGNTSK